MRLLLINFLLVICTLCFGQLKEGFDPCEAKDLIAMCNSYTFLDLYGSDVKILPKGYQKVHTSEVIGLDNRFQVYQKDGIGVINFRGSTNKVSSWIENIYSAMIPASGTMIINGQEVPYCFAKDSLAAVHSGYALATILLSNSVIEQINNLNGEGIDNFMITGHSQGGALAHLFRAYLENLSSQKLSPKFVFKTYAFANPMCGNKAFSLEYQRRFCETHSSYSIINPLDPIPRMPINYQEEGKIFSAERIQNWILKKEEFDFKKLGMDILFRKFEGPIANYIGTSNKLIENLVSKSFSSLKMPKYTKDINYHRVGTTLQIKPFDYPKIQLDLASLSEKDLLKMRPDKNGNYYKEEPSFFQHKPYNYHVAILKSYFINDYNNLYLIYLPENL